MKAIKALMISSAMILSGTAMAADGVINFTGEITAASCVASAGAGTSASGAKGQQVVDVNLGKVSIDSLTGDAGLGLAGATAINLNLDCGNTAAGLNAVKFSFDPQSGSGIDAKNNSLLKTMGSAEGVGIGLYDADSKLINLSANEGFVAPLAEDAGNYSATVSMRAAYVANGDAIVPGAANGTLPFTLTYE
ncbi:fimbrial protein [Pseudomonas denitrificans (nom. rej.)]|nr:fimbrial protein [Pseudomonas denitrificans (nom. rej.)]